MQNDPSYIKDGWLSLLGGVDSSRSPDLIDKDYCAFAGNVQFRNGKPRTRPGYSELVLTGETDLLQHNLFLNATVYFDIATGQSYHIVASGGAILKILLDDSGGGVVTDLTPTNRNNVTSRTYFCQADPYLIIQNGVNIPFIFDGTTLRRSKTGSNNPILTVSSISVVGTTATITVTDVPHGFSVGSYIQIGGIDAGDFLGEAYVTGVPSAYSVEIDCDSSDTPYVGGGEVLISFTPEVPIGTLMAYGQGRLAVASVNRDEFIIGDLIGGDVNGQVANLLRFTETTYVAEAGSFRLPAFMGRMTGMSFVPYQDTATGQGDLIVFGERGAASFNVSLPRADWKTQQVQRVLFTNIGCTSETSIVHYNGDLIFRAYDGERSYRMARATQDSYGQTSISAEVDRVLKTDTLPLLDRASGVDLDNRLLFTCAPVQEMFERRIISITLVGTTATVLVDFSHGLIVGSSFIIIGSTYADGTYTVTSVISAVSFTYTVPILIPDELDAETAILTSSPIGIDYYHRGLIALDFLPTSTNSIKAPAAYNGVWYGNEEIRLFASGIFDRTVRAFFFSRSASTETSLWEISRTGLYDIDLNGISSRIPCWLETKSYDFNNALVLKRLARGDIWLSELDGTVDFKIYWRPDQYPSWIHWYSFSIASSNTSPVEEVDPLSQLIVQNLPAYRTQITFPTPPDTENPVDGRRFRYGFNFQIRLEWVGACKVEKLVLYANEIVEGLQLGGQR